MKMLNISILAVILNLLTSASSIAKQNSDPFLWLEEVDSKRAMTWVKENNLLTHEKYAQDPLYKELYEQALVTLNGKSRLPTITQRGKWLYNLWKDDKSPRGVYRRTTLKQFEKTDPKWKTVIDLSEYSEKAGKNYSFGGMNCLTPKNEVCLVDLSYGGGDASEVKEFNLKKKKFVSNGFQLPLAKSQTSWIDEDTLFVGTDFGDGSMTKSGYPRIVKKWERNTPLSQAKTVFEASENAVYAYGFAVQNKDESITELIVEATSFWESNIYQLIDDKVIKLNLPSSSRLNGTFNDKLVLSLKQDWEFDNQKFIQGEVILADTLVLRANKGKIESIIKPDSKTVIESVSTSDNGLLITVMEDVNYKLCRFTKNEDGSWKVEAIPFKESGTINVLSIDSETGDFFVQFESFITPPSLYHVDSKTLKPRILKQQAPSFDGSQYKVEQFFTESKDGTRVPYFVVMNKNIEFNGKNPTHIFSYGGFRNTLSPSYSGSYEALSGAYGKLWLDRGGVFVLANIRGGGEYGPAWHEAALLKNRHKSYEDFEAIARDLSKRKITSPQHLGIEGRSNGGLLVTATMTRHPELYGAVICGAPLIDMMRYHKLLAGASWMGEYGNPDDKDMHDYIQSYSPYQNVNPKKQYPSIFFYTSTRDDRVHPGHARKMAALMNSQGHEVEYYENIEGGHKGFSTNEQLAHRLALSYTHLWKNLK